MKLLNYLFWWCGFLWLCMAVSLWWLLAFPLMIIGYTTCLFWLEDKNL